MDNGGIHTAVDSLSKIFAIVLGLALAEAFKQFVADKAEKPEDRIIHWDRLYALAAFLFLLIPFYQGMAQYFYDEYGSPAHPQTNSLFLLFDSVMFTLEAGLFFVMSRALPIVQWRRFYFAALLLLSVDSAWGIIVKITHPQPIGWWIALNFVSILILGIILRGFDNSKSKWGPALALVFMAIRTYLDYLLSWDFYFPS